MFGGFEQQKDDKARKRWFASTGVSLLIYGAVGVGLLFLARQTVAKPKEEPPIDVTFHAEPDAPEIKPDVPPPPPPRTDKPRVKRPGKVAPLQPGKIPDARPDEGTPSGHLEAGEQEEFGDGDGEVGEPTPPAPAPPPPEPPPPPPAPPPPPVDEPEVVVAPQPLSGNARPVYPEDARHKGVQGDVVLKVRISIAGEVIGIELLRGDEPFVAAAIAAVRTWRYRPALIDGKPSAFTRRVQIPFRIRA
jgi:periplasmic protein TonB